jgi:myo-inositol-1(or 4)-monophosphatase
VNIARGATQGHFERDLRPWDLAAAPIILVESGGRLTDWSSNLVDLSDPTAKINVAASNGYVHDAMTATLRNIAV